MAGLNPYQLNAIEGLGGFGSGAGGTISDALTDAGLAGLSGGLGGYQDILRSSTPQVGEIDFDYARRIANDPYLDSQITAALRDPYRNLTEQTLPGIDRAAAQAGQSSGSRAGVAEGIAQRGYADRASDVAASMRGDAYGRGLGMAQQQAMTNPSLALQSLGLQLNAANNMTGLGTGALGQAYGMGLQNLQTGLQGGNILQGQQQRELDTEYGQFQRNQMLPFLQAQAGLPLAGQVGGQFGTQTNTQSMNPVGGLINIGSNIAGGMIAGGMNPFGMFGSKPTTGTAVNPFMGNYNPFSGMFGIS